MQSLIWGVIGLVIMVVALICLIRLLKLKKHGITVLAEVIEVSEITSGRKKQVTGYTHRMRYEIGGKKVEADDKAGYTQPFAAGSKQLIVVDPEKPERFEYEDGLKKNITLFSVMLCVTIVFSVYWLVSGISAL